MTGISYARARALLLGAGIFVLLMLAALAYLSQADPDPVEIKGTLLFIPVFIGFVLWRVPGGVVAGVLAAGAFAFFRYPAIQSIGSDVFAIQIVSKAVFFVTFGAIGGWATKQLEGSLTKLELYDLIDDTTGLNNARFFLQDTDLEMSRAGRYQTLFSVAFVDVPNDCLAGLSKRKQASALRDLGQVLKGSVRGMDRPVHAQGKDVHKFAVILPETGAEGAKTFASRLAVKVGTYLSERGGKLSAIEGVALTLPEDEQGLAREREIFAQIERAEHPEEADGA
ncbi:MAG: hypothetical protein ABIS18_05220 [Actinomycetota bacterium]